MPIPLSADLVAECRARVERQLDALSALLAATDEFRPTPERRALTSFEPQFLTNVARMFDGYLAAHTDMVERGTPLHDLREVCAGATTVALSHHGFATLFQACLRQLQNAA